MSEIGRYNASCTCILFITFLQVGDGWKSSPLSVKAWPPYVAGALIGLLQAPIVYTVRDTLGNISILTVYEILYNIIQYYILQIIYNSNSECSHSLQLSSYYNPYDLL